MTTWVMVMMGGALGTGARYGLSLVLQPPGTSGFPLGTLTVNLVGCLLIGVLAALMPDSSQFSTSTRLGLMVGVLGGFTTFSSFGLESIGIPFGFASQRTGQHTTLNRNPQQRWIRYKTSPSGNL